MHQFHSLTATTLLLLMLLATACGRETPETDFEAFETGNFTKPTVIDNPWFPLEVGMHWVYEGTTIEEDESIPHRLEYSVTDLTKEIVGVNTVVVWIVDYSADQIVEKEIAFLAQDDDGRVWYLGEHPEEYIDGAFVDAPTWIHGIENAVAGIKMQANPQLETPSYSQGWGPKVDFQDRGQVSQIGVETCVPADCYKEVLVISEFTRVEPDAIQLKQYARGIGNIFVGWEGKDEQKEVLELVDFRYLNPDELAQVRALALDLEQHAYEISPDVYALTLPLK